MDKGKSKREGMGEGRGGGVEIKEMGGRADTKIND